MNAKIIKKTFYFDTRYIAKKYIQHFSQRDNIFQKKLGDSKNPTSLKQNIIIKQQQQQQTKTLPPPQTQTLHFFSHIFFSHSHLLSKDSGLTFHLEE